MEFPTAAEPDRPQAAHTPQNLWEGRRALYGPVMALWGESSFVGHHYDVETVWREYATDVQGEALPCDHYLPEEAPSGTTERPRSFLGGAQDRA